MLGGQTWIQPCDCQSSCWKHPLWRAEVAGMQRYCRANLANLGNLLPFTLHQSVWLQSRGGGVSLRMLLTSVSMPVSCWEEYCSLSSSAIAEACVVAVPVMALLSSVCPPACSIVSWPVSTASPSSTKERQWRQDGWVNLPVIANVVAGDGDVALSC